MPATGTRPAIHSGWALTALAAAQFLVVLATSIVNMALPAIGAGAGLGPARLYWIVNAYVLVFGALLVPAGRLGDIVGKRLVFQSGLALFSIGTLAAALSGGAGVLLGGRTVQGLGAALLAPNALGRLWPRLRTEPAAPARLRPGVPSPVPAGRRAY